MYQGVWRNTGCGPAQSARAGSRLTRAVADAVPSFATPPSCERLEARRLFAGSISGNAFVDRNSNGVLDAGETGILSAVNSKPLSVTVFLDVNSNSMFDVGVDTSTTVDASGNYSFAGLADGNYSVGEITPAGYIRTNAAFQAATVSGGGAVTGKNLANFPVVFDAGTSGNGSDQYTVRLNISDNTQRRRGR
jgi:hypothetical protein